MQVSRIVQLFKETAREWSGDKSPRLAAALAYYTLFSLAPLLVIAITVAGLVFGEEAARGELVGTIQGVIGENGARGIETMIENAGKKKDSGIVATVIGVVALLFGASGVFGQLKDALNTIWSVELAKGGGIMGFVRQRFLSFTMVLGVGFLLLVSLVLSAVLSAAGKFVGARLPGGEAVWHVVNLGVSFLVITLVFALLFKYLPDKRIAWRHVWSGAAFTALLFTIGKFAIGMYLGKSAVSSTYGAAGSLAIVLLWVYYSGLIFFFGAEFTEVHARSESPGMARRRAAGVTPPTAAAAVAAPGSRPLPAEPRRAASRGGKSAVALGFAGLVAGALIGSVATVFSLAKHARKLLPF